MRRLIVTGAAGRSGSRLNTRKIELDEQPFVILPRKRNVYIVRQTVAAGSIYDTTGKVAFKFVDKEVLQLLQPFGFIMAHCLSDFERLRKAYGSRHVFGTAT